MGETPLLDRLRSGVLPPHAHWALHERIGAITASDLAGAMYLGMVRCIAELCVRTDREATWTPKNYLAGPLLVHEQLVPAIEVGDD